MRRQGPILRVSCYGWGGMGIQDGSLLHWIFGIAVLRPYFQLVICTPLVACSERRAFAEPVLRWAGSSCHPKLAEESVLQSQIRGYGSSHTSMCLAWSLYTSMSVALRRGTMALRHVRRLQFSHVGCSPSGTAACLKRCASFRS